MKSNLNEWVIPEAQMQPFIHQFTSREQPYVFRDIALRDALLSDGHLIYTCKEFFANFPEFVMQYGALYNVWAFPDDTFVWFASDDVFDTLPQSTQYSLHQEQVMLNRGHVYPSQWFDALPAMRSELADQSSEWLTSSTSDTAYLILHHRTWHALSCQAQADWLRHWLEIEIDPVDPFVPTTFDARLTPTQISLLQRYAGRFANVGGPNCFAAATALAVGQEPQSDNIIRRWLHAEPMLRLLEARHYRPVAEYRSILHPLDAIAGDVCVWMNADGIPIHAAFIVQPDWVFQTMGQSWFQPWQVVPLAKVIDYNDTLSTGGALRIYRQASAP